MKKLFIGITILTICLMAFAGPTGKPVRLVWNLNSPVENVTNYVVYYNSGTISTNWIKLVDVPSTNVYNITGTNYGNYLFMATDPIGKFARFVVTSQNEGGESDFSPVAVTRPEAPTALQILNK